MLERRTLPRILFLTSLVLALAGLARAQESSGNSADIEKIKEEVRKVDDEWFQAVLKGDADTLDRIYADGISFTYASGQIVSKAQAVDDVRTGRNKLFVLNHDDIRVHAFGKNTVVVTGRTQSTLRCCSTSSQPAQVHRRFTDVYEKLDGRWQLIAHQVTPIAGE
jgi:uncharacterized protein (TIGR02246 family)